MFKDPIDVKNTKKFEVYLGQSLDWWLLNAQYKTALDQLITLVENGLPINRVAFPILFMVRHGLELSLKANILRMQDVTTVEKLKLNGGKSHSLDVLYNKFLQNLNQIIRKTKLSPKILEEIENYKDKIEPLKSILHKLDERSYSFRYPVDTDGNPNFNWLEKMNIADLINSFYFIQPFLLFTENVLVDAGVFANHDMKNELDL